MPDGETGAATGWFVHLTPPLDIAGARRAIAATLLAGDAGANVAIDAANDAPEAAAVADDLRWLGIAARSRDAAPPQRWTELRECDVPAASVAAGGACLGTLHARGEAGLPAIAFLRRAGFLAPVVVGYLAESAGARPATTAETAGSIDRYELTAADLRCDPATFDEADLRARNAAALRALGRQPLVELLAGAMQCAGQLEDPIPPAARRWIDTFLRAYGDAFTTLGEALAIVAALRAEAVVVPALELERLRNRQVIFFLDAVGQYVDAQPELRDLPLGHDIAAIAAEFGLAAHDALGATRMALTGQSAGPPLELVFPLLGHDRILIRIGAISSHLLHGRGLEPIRFGPGGVPFQTLGSVRPDVPN